MGRSQRMPGLDAWRGLGVLFLFHLVFFGQHIEQVRAWSPEAGPAVKIVGRLVAVLFHSGVLGLDILFMVAGFLTVRRAAAGATPLGMLLGRYGRMLPFIAVVGVPFVAYGGLSLDSYFRSLLLLIPQNVPEPLARAFAHANSFLLFSALAALWLPLSRRLGRAGVWLAFAGAGAMAGLAVHGDGWAPVNGHFLAFFWGAGVAWATGGQRGEPRLGGWAGAALLCAAALACNRLSDGRGDELYFLMDGRNWQTLELLLPLQAVLACALAVSAAAAGTWKALEPLRVLGRASNCFFMVFVLWSFTLGKAYSHEFGNPAASLGYLYALTLAITLAVALVLAPYLEVTPVFNKSPQR